MTPGFDFFGDGPRPVTDDSIERIKQLIYSGEWRDATALDMAEIYEDIGSVGHGDARRWVCNIRPCSNPASPDGRGFRYRSSLADHLRDTHPTVAAALDDMVGVSYPLGMLIAIRERMNRELTKIYLTPRGTWRKL